jgi:putative ABC transport system permease protein
MTCGFLRITDRQVAARGLQRKNISHLAAHIQDRTVEEDFSNFRRPLSFRSDQAVDSHRFWIGHQRQKPVRKVKQATFHRARGSSINTCHIQHLVALGPDRCFKQISLAGEVGIDRDFGDTCSLGNGVNRGCLKTPLHEQMLCSRNQGSALGQVLGPAAFGVSDDYRRYGFVVHDRLSYRDPAGLVECFSRFQLAIPFSLVYVHDTILIGLVWYWSNTMLAVAIRMLTGDRAKYIGLIFGVAFATLLMSQQVSIFIGLMTRTANQVLDVRDAEIWVMDPRVNYVDEVEPLRDAALQEVRGVDGVDYAVPFYKGLVILRTTDGLLNQVNLVGVDNASLVGAPRRWIVGSPESLRAPNAIVFDGNGAKFIWPGQSETSHIGRVAEINDRRVTVTGVADVRPTFITFPVAYMKYNDIMGLLPPQRKAMSFVLVRGLPGQDPRALAERISAQTGLQALTREDFAWRSVRYYLQRTGIPVNFGITIVLGLIVGIAITGQTFVLFVLENMRQFGALKAIGVTNRQILAMIFTQAGMVGLIGYGLGIGTCALFFKLTSDKAPALKGFFLPVEVIGGTAAVVLFIMIVSVLGSAQRLMRVDPAIVFRG